MEQLTAEEMLDLIIILRVDQEIIQRLDLETNKHNHLIKKLNRMYQKAMGLPNDYKLTSPKS